MPIQLVINGQNRSFENASEDFSLAQAIEQMNLQGDRVAVEWNGVIVQRDHWLETALSPGDRLEVVHFVGGGSCGRLVSKQETGRELTVR